MRKDKTEHTLKITDTLQWPCYFTWNVLTFCGDGQQHRPLTT